MDFYALLKKLSSYLDAVSAISVSDLHTFQLSAECFERIHVFLASHKQPVALRLLCTAPLRRLNAFSI